MKNRARTVARFTKVKVFKLLFMLLKTEEPNCFIQLSLLAISFVGWSCMVSHFTPLGFF